MCDPTHNPTLVFLNVFLRAEILYSYKTLHMGIHRDFVCNCQKQPTSPLVAALWSKLCPAQPMKHYSAIKMNELIT
jgi:hypothetical protein